MTAYQQTSDEASDFYLFYGMNQDGTAGWYQYDAAEGTYQRYQAAVSEEDASNADMEYLQEEYNNLSAQYKQEKSFSRNAIAVMVFISAVLLIIIVNLLVRRSERKWDGEAIRHRRGRDDLDDDDSFEDDDDLDDDDSFDNDDDLDEEKPNIKEDELPKESEEPARKKTVVEETMEEEPVKHEPLPGGLEDEEVRERHQAMESFFSEDDEEADAGRGHERREKKSERVKFSRKEKQPRKEKPVKIKKNEKPEKTDKIEKTEKTDHVDDDLEIIDFNDL